MKKEDNTTTTEKEDNTTTTTTTEKEDNTTTTEKDITHIICKQHVYQPIGNTVKFSFNLSETIIMSLAILCFGIIVGFTIGFISGFNI